MVRFKRETGDIMKWQIAKVCSGKVLGIYINNIRGTVMEVSSYGPNDPSVISVLLTSCENQAPVHKMRYCRLHCQY